MGVPQSSDGVTLGTLESLMMPTIIDSEADLKDILSQIKGGKEVTGAQLLFYTNEINQNSLTINMCGSMIKERGDTLKSATQKF